MNDSNRSIEELEQILREASDAYYGAGEDSLLSDAEFDALRDRLEQLDPDNVFLKQVGAPADSKLQKVSHTIPMGSLKKITQESEFQTWLNSVAHVNKKPMMVVQLKLDGLSIELVYKKGKFVQAITRGDGNVGEDVTHSVKNAQGFPKIISVKDDVYVRAEAMLRIADWKTHFADKKNPRNAASGTVRRTDGSGSKHLMIVAFDVLFNGFKTEQDRIKWLQNEKFTTTPSTVCSSDDVLAEIQRIEDKREKLIYEIDGAVIKMNDIADQVALGEHDGRPYWAKAWKYAAMGGHTTLEGVTWTVGTHGTINPVANVAPVNVGGTTIQNVTLHNVDEIGRLNLHIGDTVEVIRAGDVIPKIVRVVKFSDNPMNIAIHECPICSSPLVKIGVNLICSKKEECGGVLVSRIKKWIKKRDIMFLGDSATEKLIESGVVKSVADLYSLTIDSMIKGGVTEGMAKKIFKEIEKSRDCTLSDLIGSLSLDMLGRSEASNLVAHGINSLAKWRNITAAEIEAIPGYQSTKATRISTSVHDNWVLIESVANCLRLQAPAPKVSGGKLSGKSFCFTGTMNKTRKELESLVAANGGDVRSVSKELTFLVIADVNSPSSKAVKARKLGTKLITEDDFLRMI